MSARQIFQIVMLYRPLNFVFLLQAMNFVSGSWEKWLDTFCFPSRMVYYLRITFPCRSASGLCICSMFNLQSMIPPAKVEYLLSYFRGFFFFFFFFFRKKCTSEAADLRPCRDLLYKASASVLAKVYGTKLLFAYWNCPLPYFGKTVWAFSCLFCKKHECK